MPARLNPYLTFQGDAREAMEYYHDILGGNLVLTTYAEGGMSDNPAEADKVMHGQLETDSGFTLMGGDAPSGVPAQPMSGVQISLSGDTEADAELSGYYDKLAQKGTVVEPLVTAPWGDKFGMVTDPYGVLWMVNIWGRSTRAERMPHPLVDQLRFTRSEFMRGIHGIGEADAQRRIEPMNAIGWNVGHLAWQEQQYFLTWPSGARPYPDIDREFISGGPPSTPTLERVLEAWHAITAAADPWLDALASEDLERHVVSGGRELRRRYGDLLQRVIYHYWFHTGENAAIRQALGHTKLPQFVGSIDTKAPYRPDR